MTDEQQLLSLMPHAEALGIRIELAGAEETRASLDWKPELCTAGGVMHGGVIVSLADTVAALCAYLNLPPGSATTTIESKTNFLRAVREGTLHACAHPLHVGRSVIVLEASLTDAQQRRVAHTLQTQAVIGARA